MKKIKKNYEHTIWENSYFWTNEERDEIVESIKDDNPEYDDQYAIDVAEDVNSDNLCIIREDLGNIKTNTIIVIADLGLWNGCRIGYKEIKSLKDCFYSDCDYCRWYVDRYNMRSTQIHHDGTNELLYRIRKDGVSDYQWENFLGKIYDEKVTKADITKYTASLRPLISEFYGW